ncbi:MAG: hypothetical protein EBR30_12550 [Cytophagia bacterium]|nr:hypothetical protein [Cytophagia bacterium]
MAAVAFNFNQGALTFIVDDNDFISGTVNGNTVNADSPVTVQNNAQFSFNYCPGAPSYPSADWLVVSNVTGTDEVWTIHIEFINDGMEGCTLSGYAVYSTNQSTIAGSKIVTGLYKNARIITLNSSEPYSIPGGFSASGLTGSITITP